MQTLRELLDADVASVVVKERELEYTLRHVVREPPALVVTDSQAFLKVDADVPPNVPLTRFSILFARHKGDLAEAVRGVRAISKLRSGSRVLIAEACSHRPISEDIGRVKLPRWISSYTGVDVMFDVRAGHDFPDDLTGYDLVIQCGGCMVNRAAMLSRFRRAREQGVPITNYGIPLRICTEFYRGPSACSRMPWRHGKPVHKKFQEDAGKSAPAAKVRTSARGLVSEGPKPTLRQKRSCAGTGLRTTKSRKPSSKKRRHERL